MARRFTFEEDRFIYLNFAEAGAFNLADDLNRSEAAITTRARKLKACGGWAAIEKIEAAEKEYRLAVGRPALWDMDDEVAE